MTLAIDRDFLLGTSDLSVSLYMAIEPAQRDLRAAEGRAHALLGATRDELSRRGIPKRTQSSILDGLRGALDGLDLRKHRDPGLVLLATPESSRLLPLPERVADESIVGRHFFIRPLLRILRDEAFFVLMVSAQGARLLECGRYQWRERTSPALGQKLDEVRVATEFDGGVQQSPVARPHVGSPAPAVKAHAYESPAEVGKAEFISHLRRVAAAVEAELRNDRRPVVLVAEAETSGHFRKLAKLPQLAEQGVAVFPNGQGDGVIVARAREVIGDPDDAAVTQLLDQVNARLGANRRTVTIRLDDTLRAAYEGRVDAVIVAADDKVWGRFDPATRVVLAHTTPTPGDEELLNNIVVQTLARGGVAFALPRDRLPREALVAATLRY